MDIYPENLNILLDDLHNAGSIKSPTISAVSASFECGTAITVDLVIDPDAKQIEQVRFRTNGCGYMTAAGELVARSFNGRRLAAIGGSIDAELSDLMNEAIGSIPIERDHCQTTAVEAIKKALASYRAKAASEYNGESPLVCSCYGIDEEGVLATIKREQVVELNRFLKYSRAGSGCGSCRMVIEDMIAAHNDEFAA